MTTLLPARLERTTPTSTPSHHVLATSSSSSWSSYLPSLNPTPGATRPRREGPLTSLSRSSSKRSNSGSGVDGNETRTGFRNPWPSWHKPTRKETWDNLEWGEDSDPCIELAAASVTSTGNAAALRRRGSKRLQRKGSKDGNGNGLKEGDKAALASQLLRVVEPDFSFDAKSERAKVTWLGHASMLVQLPSLYSSPDTNNTRPLRILFDPIFSTRASPVQTAGPTRFYPPPCTVDALPPIDIMFLSHNHYDHLDYVTVMALWRNNKEWIRFVVPLGNGKWFVECGIPGERVEEMDWWDGLVVGEEGQGGGVEGGEKGGKRKGKELKVTCTPSQHQSGRSGLDTDVALWSSWFLEHPGGPASDGEPYRVFFAGDTGFQFHASPDWPPPPPSTISAPKSSTSTADANNPYPPCPDFADIVSRLGPPDLLLLPIWVGGTYDFVRSWVPLSDALSPMPRLKVGLTAANHMPPWDAVRVLRLMTEGKVGEKGETKGEGEGEGEKKRNGKGKGKGPVAVAMHWGTFITEPVEVLKTLGQLQWACEAQGVHFGRELERGNESEEKAAETCFLALDHGQSVVL